MTLDVDNITALSVQHPGRLLSNYLESQITKFLRQFSLSRLEDVNILNISESGQTSFHLFGDPLDLSKVRLAQRQLSVTWRIGEVLLSKLPVTLRHEQGLRLEDIQANNGEVFENEQVILSCIAQGSEQMEFSWYKDGQPIDPFKGFGGVWMHILPKNSREEYTAILGIDAAKVVDEGWYTCQVMDWGVQECKSVYLEVEAPPDILVSPMAASVKKGDNIDLTCVSTNQKVSYTWSREKKLFPLNPDSEVWEDLKPWGSILRIKNVQKSVTYTCHALAKGATSEKSIHIDLLAPGSCKESQELEIIWKPTSPGSLAMAECPSRLPNKSECFKFVGYSSRYCLAVTPGESSWEEPDYSKCVSENLDRIMTQFQVISRGTMKTNLWTLLSELNSWLHSRALLHGEGESVLDLLSDVATLLNLTSTSEEVLNVTEVFYANVDLLLSQPTSFTHIEKVGKLQRLVDEWSLMWAQHLNQTSAYLLYSEIVIDVRKLSNEAYHQYYIPTLNSYPHWYTANIGINIASQGGQMNMVTVINYHNISNFLPTLSSHILSDGSELLYKVGSNVISISAYGEMKIRLDMMLPLQNEDRIKWNMSCARADTIGSEWDFTSCLQVPGAGNSSHCVCNRPGLYAALLTRVRSDKTQQPGRELSSPIIALGCSCCLVQSCLTLLLLCCRGAFMQLFKVQFCLAVSSIMAIFVHVTRVVPTKDMYMLISILLELLFFFALSSHLGKLLIVYSEVVFVRNSKNAKLTILGLTTGVSLLPCLISGTAESFSAGEFRNSWWLPIGSASFYTATASTFFITLLIIMLSVGLIRRLHYLKATKNSESNQDINRRLGLMKRTSVLFTMTVLVAISSVFLANKPTSLNIYIFSSLSGFLGFLIFVSYILHSESALNIQLIKQLRITANDRGLSSSSDYNLFNFCTKKESEAENRDIPLPIRESGTEMKEIPNNFFNKPKLVTLKKQSTIENEQRNIDLEVYPNSPRKFFHSAGDGTCCSTKIIPQIDTNKKNRVKTVISQRTDVEQVQLLEDDFPRIAGPSNVLDSISHDLDCLRNGCPPILRGKDCGLLGDGGPLGSSNSLGYLGKHNL